ncbi:uncharacterized protein LOC141898226 [Tubulanus polymorphus]|uniref:uncharacterized protein LOC141898226 n=1 Tax=Tubulanus polymorphus TaxID=672921 RepID=UPI003DA4A7B1
MSKVTPVNDTLVNGTPVNDDVENGGEQSEDTASKSERFKKWMKGPLKDWLKGPLKEWFKDNALLVAMILAMIIGIGMGIGLRLKPTPWTKREIMYLAFPGQLLLRMLKMLILPLIISSLISGLAALDSKASGRIGLFTIAYYMCTTIIAVILGIILVLAIKPGSNSEIKSTRKSRIVNPVDSILDLIRNMFPMNLVEATFKQTKTVLVKEKTEVVSTTTATAITSAMQTTMGTFVQETDEGYYPTVTLSSGSNILGIVVFVIAFGIVIGRLGEKGRPLVLFFDSLNEAVMKLITIVIWYSPIGVVFLVAAKIVAMDKPTEVLTQLGKYMGTVLAGLAIHGLIILPVIYAVIVRKNPFTFIYKVGQALITALATASSAATLPVTFQCLEEKNKVDKRVTRFMLPIGATINMDGTALYEAVAAIFIAQINNITLSFGQVIVVSITATAASIGAAGVPQAGLVTMIIVLTAVGLPSDDISLILAIDWFLDRFRTSVNVLGDSIGTGVVEKLCHEQLKDPADDIELKPVENEVGETNENSVVEKQVPKPNSSNGIEPKNDAESKNKTNTKKAFNMSSVTYPPANDDVENGGEQSKNTAPKSSSEKCRIWFKDNALLIAMILAMIIGIGMGIGLRLKPTPWTKREIMYLAFPGQLLLRMLKMLILPLIISSLISGLAALDSKASGRIGLFTIAYYMCTTIIAVILGIILVLAIKPGSNSEIKSTRKSRIVNPVDSILDLIRNMFPMNLIEATFKQTKTVLVKEKIKVVSTTTATTLMSSVSNATQTTIGTFVQETDEGYYPTVTLSSGSNILGIVVFVIAFGIVIGRLGEKGRPLVVFFDSLNEAIMKLIRIVIWYSPIGVIFLVAAKIVAMDKPAVILAQLGKYMGTVLAGLAIHGLIILPVIYAVIVRKNPFTFIYKVVQALITALATASSSATLPVTFQCLEEKNKVDKRVTRFMLPIGATINMDGTALYEAVAAIFIAQINNITLSVGQVIVVSITATAASIGAAGVPQAGLVTMIIVLTAVGLPSNDISLILAIDWFLDRFRTSVNVLGDSIGTGVVEKLCHEQLKYSADDIELMPVENEVGITNENCVVEKQVQPSLENSSDEIEPTDAKL